MDTDHTIRAWRAAEVLTVVDVKLLEQRVRTAHNGVPMGILDRLRGKQKSKPELPIEAGMVFALQATTSAGPNDLLNGQDGKPYWVSTVRYPAGHWQTAVFDQSLPGPLNSPLFLMNTTAGPTDALINHLAALILLAERSEIRVAKRDARSMLGTCMAERSPSRYGSPAAGTKRG
jgi:hypothetical protein